MKEEYFKTIMAENLEETQEVKTELYEIKAILSNHSKQINDFNNYLANYKVQIPDEKFQPYVNGLNELYKGIMDTFSKEIEQKKQLKLGHFKQIKELVTKVTLISISAILIGYFSIQSIRDRFKYKTIYDKIYYSGEQEKKYLTRLLDEYKNDSTRVLMRSFIKEKRQESKQNE